MRPTISAELARRHLLSHLGLARKREKGLAGIRRVLARRRCIQLDPLDAIGENADLVVLARVDGIKRGDVYRALLPGSAFEHFAKERCLIEASAFPLYRDRSAEQPWWRLTERARRVPAEVLEAVYEEVAERGSVSARELTDHGRVQALDWSGWKGTSKMTSMALEILWTRCRLVVAGRGHDGAKRYDLPERSLGAHAIAPSGDFEREGVLTRVDAAGLLARATGPTWSMLRDARTSGLVDTLIEEGAIEEVRVEGSSRPYLAPSGFRDRIGRGYVDRKMRVLGPLEPLLWDRKLVRQVFGFDYIWEVYKPAAKRRWGWYVCPLLHRGRLVGRIEAKVQEGELRVLNLWPEDDVDLDRDALDAALSRHAKACQAEYHPIA